MERRLATGTRNSKAPRELTDLLRRYEPDVQSVALAMRTAVLDEIGPCYETIFQVYRNNVVYASNPGTYVLGGTTGTGSDPFAGLTLDHNLWYHASNPRPFHWGFYEFDLATRKTRELLTPEMVLKGAEEKLSAEEKARRERQQARRQADGVNEDERLRHTVCLTRPVTEPSRARVSDRVTKEWTANLAGG